MKLLSKRPFGYVPDYLASRGLRNALKHLYFRLFGTPFYIRRVEARLIYDLLGALPSPRCVVDIGAGDGLFTFPLASNDASGIGVDRSRPALSRGRWRAALMSVADKVHFIQADATALPFKPKSIDGFIANSTLEHIPDDEVVLSEISRALKPNGVFSITVPTDLSSQTAILRPLPALLLKAPRAIRHWVGSKALADSSSMREYLERSLEDYDHARFGYSEAEITSKLRRAGLQVGDVRRYLKFFGALGVDATQGLRVFGITKGGEFGYDADHEAAWGLAAPVFSALSRLDILLPSSVSSIGVAVSARKPAD